MSTEVITGEVKYVMAIFYTFQHGENDTTA